MENHINFISRLNEEIPTNLTNNVAVNSVNSTAIDPFEIVIIFFWNNF